MSQEKLPGAPGGACPRLGAELPELHMGEVTDVKVRRALHSPEPCGHGNPHQKLHPRMIKEHSH